MLPTALNPLWNQVIQRTSYLDLVFVASALERIGDHATNIAEDSFWRDQATDIRHTYGPKKED
jgi:phosphate uptake regulator